jgi:NADH-quinone oxidoreductase subunit G
VPLHHIFGSEELSALAPAIAERVPRASVALGTDDLQRLGVKDGDEVTVTVGDRSHRLVARELPSMPLGIAGVMVGLPSAPWLPLPAPGRIVTAEATR